MTLDQIQRRVAVARRMYSHYVPFVEHCELILHQAHDLGWKVALMLNDEHSIRRAESLLGAHIRGDFKASTPLSRLIYGI